MKQIEEVRRLASPAPQPQSLAFAGPTLWMGSRQTRRIFAIDVATWSAREQGEAPGVPYGMTFAGDELRVLCGEGSDDNRVVRRFTAGRGFSADAIPCPDDTGSQLSFDGERLYVSQWYNKKLIALAADGTPHDVIDVPHGICGQVIVDGVFYLVTTDDEDDGEYWLTRVDARGAAPRCEDLAVIPFPARALTVDGERFWTNHRAAAEIVAFARPGA